MLSWPAWRATASEVLPIRARSPTTALRTTSSNVGGLVRTHAHLLPRNFSCYATSGRPRGASDRVCRRMPGSMDSDRRKHDRLRLAIPVRVQGYLAGGATWEEISTTIDVSQRGVCFPAQPPARARTRAAADPGPAQATAQLRHDRLRLPGLLARPVRGTPQRAAPSRRAVLRGVPSTRLPGASRRPIPPAGRSHAHGARSPEARPKARHAAASGSAGTAVATAPAATAVHRGHAARSRAPARRRPSSSRQPTSMSSVGRAARRRVRELHAPADRHAGRRPPAGADGRRQHQPRRRARDDDASFQVGDVVLLQEAGGAFATRAEIRDVTRSQPTFERLHLRFLDRQAPDRLLR